MIVQNRTAETDNPETLMISFPKAGRTWLSFIMSRVIQRRYNLPETDVAYLEKISRCCSGISPVSVTHEDNPQDKTPEMLCRDKSSYSDKKVMLLVRDPRDIIVSWYFHKSNRKTGTDRYVGTLSAFLEESSGNFDTLIEYYNIWEQNRHIPLDFLLIRYEDLRGDCTKPAKDVMKFIGLHDVSDLEISDAVTFSSFDNMKKMESEDRFRLKRLRPGDANNNDSYKVRRGIVGGYKDYLSDKDLEKINNKLSHLSTYYGYSI